MGFVTCGIHSRRRCCWRCDRCPACNPSVGRLTKGDYCAKCVREMKAAGAVWSDYLQNYEMPKPTAPSARTTNQRTNRPI